MKNHILIPAPVTALAILSCLTCLVEAQGNLTPPGPPGPTMKSLDQIEPRTDILKLSGDATAMHVISAPGSYFLSGNLTADADKSGIRIAASNVTLDLAGFHMTGGSQSNTSGVQISGNVEGISIANGKISGFFNLIAASSSGAPGENSMTRTTVSRIHGSGSTNFGINLGDHFSNVVEHCSVTGSILCIQAGQVHHCVAETAMFQGQFAIVASSMVSYSTGIATGFPSTGISGGNVENCKGQGSDVGINGENVCRSTGEGRKGIIASGSVSDSKGSGDSGEGIEAQGNVSNSEGVSSLGNGIDTSANVMNCTGSSIRGTGIRALGSVSNSTGIGSSIYDFGADPTGEDPGYFEAGWGIVAEIITHSRGVQESNHDTLTGGGLLSVTAIGCTSSGNDSITNKYMMP